MKALVFSTSVPRYLALKGLGRISRRVYYRGPLAAVKLADVPEPAAPRARWVKVKTLMCGFCASDLNLIFLRDSPTASPFTSFPCVLGHEICGEVAEVGPEVENLSPGDLVTVAPHLPCAARGIDPPCPACRRGLVGSCQNFARGNLGPGMFIGICADTGGGFAPYHLAHHSQIFRLPDGVTNEQGAMIEPLSVALQAVLDNRPRAGERVLVIGGGVIGSLIVQALRALGPDCTVAVSEPSSFAAEYCRRAGADEVLTGGDLLTHAVKLTGAERYKPLIGRDILMGGFDRVFDCVGNSRTLNTALRAMSAGGNLSVVGIGHDVKLDLTPLWLKRQTLRGVFSYGYIGRNAEKRHVFDLAIELVQGKKVDLDLMVTHRFELDDFGRMIEVNLNKDAFGAMKTVVSFV